MIIIEFLRPWCRKSLINNIIIMQYCAINVLSNSVLIHNIDNQRDVLTLMNLNLKLKKKKKIGIIEFPVDFPNFFFKKFK